jgi:transposase-like protein
LAARRSGEYELALESELQTPQDSCPNCSSTDIQTLRSATSRLIAIAWFFVFNIIVPPPFNGMRCKSCKSRFNHAR